eukprot:GHRQ01019094.1.p1 GENE.GHRQ01019094.1~~GHRQ01019094.1.p1  ORF type:complete len:111 (+),score=25.58 GHRQ01019094.1:227-559(+)
MLTTILTRLLSCPAWLLLHAPHSVAGVSQALYLLSDDSVKDAASSSSGGAFGFLADGFEAFLKVPAAPPHQHQAAPTLWQQAARLQTQHKWQHCPASSSRKSAMRTVFSL